MECPPVVVRLLLDHGALVDDESSTGYTPLHLAAEQGQTVVAQLLLERGADVEALTHSGGMPLHWAAHHNRAATAALLIRHGAPLNKKDGEGHTPVSLAMQAAKNGKGADVLEMLKTMARHDKEHRRGKWKKGKPRSERVEKLWDKQPRDEL